MATADDARGEFAKYITYDDIDSYALDMLTSFLMHWLANHNIKQPRDGVRMFPRRAERVRWAKSGGIIEAYIRVDGDYFRDREAVSFNRDGHIGFCGWASSENAEPIVIGFIRWVWWMDRVKQRKQMLAKAGDGE